MKVGHLMKIVMVCDSCTGLEPSNLLFSAVWVGDERYRCYDGGGFNGCDTGHGYAI